VGVFASYPGPVVVPGFFPIGGVGTGIDFTGATSDRGSGVVVPVERLSVDQRIMSQKNLASLTRLLVQTWGTRALGRARFLAGQNPNRVRLMTMVDRLLKEGFVQIVMEDGHVSR
jgi:hypothetical protein